MWTFAILTLAVLFALGWTINAVLFAPYRVKPIYRFLYRRSGWYRRWVFNRIVLPSMRRMTAGFAALVPAAQRATEAFRGLSAALAKLEPPEVRSR